MKKIKIGILILLVFSLTACGNSNYILEDNTPVEYKKQVRFCKRIFYVSQKIKS